MGESNISNLMLERYNLGELNQEEKTLVEKAIESDLELQARFSDLKRSDFEFRNRYPAAAVLNRNNEKTQKRRTFTIISGICAAVLFVGISFPLVWNQINSTETTGDVAKGAGSLFQSAKTDLSVYLKTDQKSTVYEGLPLHEGNTIQLAYTVPGIRYGVIFSIDGRSEVTLHYPYSMNGNTQLASGKQTVLEEAYMLDDAPNYEVFFFVVSKTPLDTRAIINSAESIAGNTKLQPKNLIDKSKTVFGNYEVKTVYLRKE